MTMPTGMPAPVKGSRTNLFPAFREHSEANTIRVRNGRIGSIDPSALKIPARRAESSLLYQFHILIFTLSQHKTRRCATDRWY